MKDVYLNIIAGNFNRDLWKKVEDFLCNYNDQERLKGIDETFMAKEKELKEFLSTGQASKPIDDYLKRMF